MLELDLRWVWICSLEHRKLPIEQVQDRRVRTPKAAAVLVPECSTASEGLGDLALNGQGG